MCKKKTIFKGFHRPIGLPAFLFPMGYAKDLKTISLKKTVKFYPSCAYDLQSGKQGDWNKLYGVCFGITGIHKNSIRFGWRYNAKKNTVELCSIVYDKGIPSRKYLSEHDLPLNAEANFEIKYSITPRGNLEFKFIVNDQCADTGHIENLPTNFYFGCGFYFGGTSRAPHKISAYIK